VRRVYEARARLALGQPPTMQQAEAANVWSRLRALGIPLHITAQTEHILQRRPAVFATALLMHTRALQKGRYYLRRWARSLRDISFSPEDAIVLAYGSFGLNQTTEDWYTRFVTLSATKGLSERFFALLRMTRVRGHVVKCTNVMWFDLDLQV